MSRLDLLERVAMLAMHVRKLEFGLVSEQNALEVRERLQKTRKALDTTLCELNSSDPSGAYRDHFGACIKTPQKGHIKDRLK